MVDTYKVSRDLSLIKLDEFFHKFKLHEQTNLVHLEKGIVLVVDNWESTQVKPKSKVKSKATYKSRSDSESEFGDEDLSSYIANAIKRMIKRKKFTRRGVKKEF